jgi:hypothetical protein
VLQSAVRANQEHSAVACNVSHRPHAEEREELTHERAAVQRGVWPASRVTTHEAGGISTAVEKQEPGKERRRAAFIQLGSELTAEEE